MSTFEVKVRKLTIQPHPNADTLELAVIDGYQSCVRKSEFATGDLGVYLPEASIVPHWMLEKMNLVDKLSGGQKNRIKIVKLRGQISQGIVYPVHLASATGKYAMALENGEALIVKEGDEVGEELGIRKYEPAIPSQLGGNRTKQIGNAPTIRNWDVENVKKYHKVLQEGEEVVVTEKIHGCADYDTLIDTVEYGLIKIGKVVDDKLECHVKSMDLDSNEIEFNEVTNWSCQPNIDNWYEIVLEDGSAIKLTANHLVWLPELNAYRTVMDLTEGDTVLVD